MFPLASENLTHTELVTIARDWLNLRQCSVVVSEINTHADERPDAIGWKGSKSILIECKTSRTDFRADRQKFFREYLDMGMGDYRYFLAPPGVIKDAHELPEGFGWLEVNPATRKVRTRKKAELQSAKNAASEILILTSLVRRIGLNAPEGVSIRCYTIENKRTSVLEILAEGKT